MINLALIGYGKMGKMIESVIDSKEYQIVGIYDIANPPIDYLKDKPDVVIEFTEPRSVIDNIRFLAEKKINIVCGTTGWYDKIDEVRKIIENAKVGFIYASNFSVGVNLFFQMVSLAGKLIDKYPQYNIGIEETHHTTKLDKPSGTAIRLGEYLLKEISRKDKHVNDSAKPLQNEINILSHRMENVVGNHKVLFDSVADSIVLEHNAKSRRGFAEGALLAAKFIHKKKGFYKFEEVFSDMTF
jgi:4-hydroxy-tetrahydrodipicolinate reductase